MAASARRKPRARRSAPARPTLEQRHWDLIGLGLVACAIFLAFLVYLGWEGGTVWSAVVDGLKDVVGEVHALVPVAMLAAGGSRYPIDLLRDAGVDMTTPAPFRAAMEEMNGTMDEMERILRTTLQQAQHLL